MRSNNTRRRALRSNAAANPTKSLVRHSFSQARRRVLRAARWFGLTAGLRKAGGERCNNGRREVFARQPFDGPEAARIGEVEFDDPGICKIYGDKPNSVRMQLRGNRALCMLVDQKLREGIAVPFFGHDAMTTPAPAALALKTGARICIAANRRSAGARFHVTVSPILDFNPSGDEARDTQALTAAITAAIEQIVRDDPGGIKLHILVGDLRNRLLLQRSEQLQFRGPDASA